MEIKNLFKKENKQFVTAKEAFESTKEPQLKNVIRNINESRQAGRTSTYVADNEELHSETIEALLSKGYDVEITHYNNPIGFEWINEVFWNKKASGKIRKSKEE